jgi:ribosomal protein S18 acetylase RimI-like enzyme
MPVREPTRLTELTAGQLRARLDEALRIYVTAMRYPPSTAGHRSPMWLEHMLRAGWLCVAAFEGEALVGIGYGYRGAPGQWWHDEVHVHPDSQGRGIGAALLTELLSKVDAPRVLLSTPEGPTRAWRLYRRFGFTDLLRHYHFTGDSRDFAVLGRTLPL